MSKVEELVQDLDTSMSEVFAGLMQGWNHGPKPKAE